METKSEMINRIAELAKENAELKAENEKLKEEIKEKESEIRQKRMTILMNNDHYLTVDEKKRKYKQTLQEIKEIAESVIDDDNSLKTDHCFGYCDECSSFNHCKLYPYWQIIHLITKAKEE